VEIAVILEKELLDFLLDPFQVGVALAVADGNHFLLGLAGGVIPLVFLLFVKAPAFIEVPA
jgi:hypothetical protein